MTDTPLDDLHLSPEARARLLDREQVAAAYAQNGIRGAAKELRTGYVPLGVALRWHGIRVRKRGEKPPGLGPTRRDVIRAVFRAYARADRCPPSCPGRDQCLLPGRPCVLEELT